LKYLFLTLPNLSQHYLILIVNYPGEFNPGIRFYHQLIHRLIFHFPNNIWDDTSEIKFQNTLSNTHFQKQISDFVHDYIDLTRDNINNACSKLELIITDAADSCLKRPKLKKNNKRKGLSHKKWYDCDLKKTKKGTG
jgi:hypothetical protein